MTSSPITQLILGWFDTIITAPEIKDILTKELRRRIKRKKEQISECAANLFLNDYNGYDLLQNQAIIDIEQSLIHSVRICLQQI